MVDKVEVMIAPMIIGHGINAIHDLGVQTVNESVMLDKMRWRRVGPDLHVAARVIYEENGDVHRPD
jgi:riboflavin biosynthesis pyrimidine reductase